MSSPPSQPEARASAAPPTDARPAAAPPLVPAAADLADMAAALRPHARLLAGLREAVHVIDAHGVIVHANPAAERLFGYAPGALVGQPAHVLDGRPSDAAGIAAALDAHGWWEGQCERVRQDGTPFVTRTRLTALDLDGRPYRVSADDDVTEGERLRFAERAARERAERLQALTAALSAARTVADAARVITAEGRRVLGADGAGVALLEDEGRTFRYVALDGVPDDIVAAWATFPNTSETPFGHVVASRAPLVLGSLVEIGRRFPAVLAPSAQQGTAALVVLPLLGSDGVPLGAAHLSYRAPHVPEAADVAGVIALAQQCAETLERARLYEAERAARAGYARQVRLFEGIADTTPDFVYLFDRAGRFQYANRRLLEVWGLALDEAVGRTCLELGYPAWHHELHMREIATVIATRRPISGEVPFEAPRTGIRGVYEYIFTPVLGPDGDVELVAGTTRDVTGRKEAEAERERLLHAAEAAARRATLLQDLTAALSQALTREQLARVVVERVAAALGAHLGVLALVTPDGERLAVAAAERLSRETHEAWATFPLDSAVPLAEAVRLGRPVLLPTFDAIATHAPSIAEMCRTYGTEALCAVPLLAVDGRALGALGLSFPASRTFDDDVGLLETLAVQAAQALERTRLFEAEQAARAEAEAANRAKSEFLAVMSHELRTPLNAIGGYAELLALGIRGPVTPEQREDLRRIQVSQRHLLGLINEVLNYARLETGRVHYALAPVAAADALAEAEALIAPQARARGLALTVAPCPPGLAVRADAEKLRQILVNLLSNAVKFTERGGAVTLTCHPVSAMNPAGDGKHDAAGDATHDIANEAVASVAITVQDTGIGIAPDQQARIFDPFVQVRADLARPAEGAGLGLAISRELARAMGGDLTVESAPGVGSTFTLTLPAA